MAPPLRTSPLRRSPIRTSKSCSNSLQANPLETRVSVYTTNSELNMDQSRKHRGCSAIKCVFLVIILFSFTLYIKVILLAFYSSEQSAKSPLLSYRMIKPYGVIKSLIDYNPMVESLSSDLKSTIPTQKVFLVPQIPDVNKTGEQKHILFEGISRSDVLEETLDPDDPDAVWVVNLLKYSCIGETVPFVQARWDRMVSKGQELRPWKIYLLDFADERYRYANNCIKQINTIFSNATIPTGEKYVHFGTRQPISFRHIVHKHGDSEELPFAQMGKQITLRGVDSVVNGTTRALRYGVRSDLVDRIEKIMREKLEKESSDLDIVTIPKPKDVAHFWNWSGHRGSAALRNLVTNKLLDYAKQPENANLTIFAKQVGQTRRSGRKDVSMEYAEALLEFKIVVVAQRDWHEDHYRLMEALISGAMVMTDPMHPLPYHIEHKKQVVVYNSIKELRNYITYYLNHAEERLTIARSGYEIAMTEHRSWHWMERLVLGDWSNAHGGN